MLICLSAAFCGYGNGIKIDFLDGKFIFNQKLLSSKEGLKLGIVNCYSKNYITTRQNLSVRPLLVFQVFEPSIDSINVNTQTPLLSFQECLDSLMTQLEADMNLRVDDLIQSSDLEYYSLMFDTLMIVSGKNTMLFKGVIKLDFFNIIEFKQVHPLQINQTIFNIKGPIVPVYSWTKDSIPIFNVDYIDKKIFLQKKIKNNYWFYRYPEYNEDSISSFPVGYLYSKEYGVVSLRTRIMIAKTARDGNRVVILSDKYYLFK